MRRKYWHVATCTITPTRGWSSDRLPTQDCLKDSNISGWRLWHVLKYSIHQGVDAVGELSLEAWVIAMEHLAISGRKASRDLKVHRTAILLVLCVRRYPLVRGMGQSVNERGNNMPNLRIRASASKSNVSSKCCHVAATDGQSFHTAPLFATGMVCAL